MTSLRRITLPAVVGVATVALISACSGSSTDRAAGSSPSAAVSSSPVASPAASSAPPSQSPSSAAASPSPEATASAKPSAVPADPTKHNASDIRFAASMIPHHLQALDMTILSSNRTMDQWVRDLANRISSSQESQIRAMKGWLDDWDSEPLPRDQALPGSVSRSDLAKLADASGAAFDRLFVTLMIDHHLGAIKLAEAELAAGTYGKARDLATSIAATKKAEVKEMRKYLTKLK
ncbi:DUF305 domain-containing protein [Streptosporangiaceae bacterium NEAU-GS5]|nr:DUF305 domain-containing protein [Streptosporangiaceae bacterium NEAU-GS5]